MDEYFDREALIEWLKRIPLRDLSDGRGLCRVIMEDDFKKAIKKMPKGIVADVAPVRHGRWIPVTERLPEKNNQWVLCLCVSGAIEVLKFDYTMWNWDAQYPGRCYMENYVTHWMPLPEPPKEVK